MHLSVVGLKTLTSPFAKGPDSVYEQWSRFSQSQRAGRHLLVRTPWISGSSDQLQFSESNLDDYWSSDSVN